MKIVFTKSNRLFSKLIMAVTDEPVSHVILEFGEFVIHSNLLGLHVESKESFYKTSFPVFSVDCHDLEEHPLFHLLASEEHSLYDFGAFLFLGISLLARHYLRIPLPKSNLWQATGMFICTEWITRVIDQKEDSMITPYKLYLRLNSKQRT